MYIDIFHTIDIGFHPSFLPIFENNFLYTKFVLKK